MTPQDFGLLECWMFDSTPTNVQVALTAPCGRQAYAILDDDRGVWILADEGEATARPETVSAFADADWQAAAESAYRSEELEPR